MKKKKKILFTILAVLFIVYITGYFIIRQKHREVHEMDGCPAGGYIAIEFPAEDFYNIYRPLIGLDIFFTNTDFCNHGRRCLK
jgi:hypothetical protein